MQRLPKKEVSIIPIYMLNKLRFGTVLIAALLFNFKQCCCHMVVLTLSDNKRAILPNVDLSNGALHRVLWSFTSATLLDCIPLWQRYSFTLGVF